MSPIIAANPNEGRTEERRGRMKPRFGSTPLNERFKDVLRKISSYFCAIEFSNNGVAPTAYAGYSSRVTRPQCLIKFV